MDNGRPRDDENGGSGEFLMEVVCEQECAADGQGFGPCRERHPPPRCDGIARRERASPELEQCCIDDGYCCLDQHDLDHDGNRGDMLGACDGVRCP